METQLCCIISLVSFPISQLWRLASDLLSVKDYKLFSVLLIIPSKLANS